MFFAALAIILPMNAHAKLQAELLPRRHEPAVMLQLIDTVRDAVKSIAKRFAIFHGLGIDGQRDFESVGIIAVWGAISEYDPARCPNFANFVLRRARWAMWEEASENLGVVRMPAHAFLGCSGRMPAAMRDKPSKNMTVERFLSAGAARVREGSGEDRLDATRRSAQLWDVIAKMPERPRQVLTLELRRDLNGPQIAELLGVSKQRIGKIREFGIEILTDYFLHGVEPSPNRREVKRKGRLSGLNRPKLPKLGWTTRPKKEASA